MEFNRQGRTAQETALNNPMILTEIFKRASTSLKNCRLVCHFWNDIVLALPNTRLAFKLNHEDEDSDKAVQFFALCFTLDERLAKRIKSDTKCSIAFDSRLMHLCDKFSDRVQILELSIWDEDCLLAVYQVLKNCCPNLKQLLIEGSFVDEENDLLEEPTLPVKPNLTVFSFTSPAMTPLLATLIHLVVNASRNLREVTIPWGCFPDFANSKCLNSLTIEQDDDDDVDPGDIIRGDDDLAELGRMLGQVGDQLVSLIFTNESDLAETLPPNGFQLRVGKLPKLQTFRNDLIDVFQCDDLFQNMEMLPSLKTLEIAAAQNKTTRMGEFLQNISNSKKTLDSLKSLEIRDIYDPRILDGLTKAFPALERFRMDTYYETIADGEVNRMELGVILQACGGWKGLKHLHLVLPRYLGEMVVVIRAFLQGREVFQRLTTSVIRAHEGHFLKHELTKIELDMFKELILAMDGMDSVSVYNISLSEESVANVLTFMASNNLDVAKFGLQQGSPYRRDAD